MPAQSPDWRYYRILEQRYIEALSPVEVMQQLSLGKSQFYRDQAHGFDLLAEQLWQQVQPAPDHASAQTESMIPVNVDSEAQRLSPVGEWKQIQLAELLESLRPIFEPLTRMHGVDYDASLLYDLPPVLTDRVTLRQTLINVLTCALTSAQETTVRLTPHLDDETIGLSVAFEPLHSADSTARLEPAARFMEVLGGAFWAEEAEGRQRISLHWPHQREKVLLIIDDNQGLVSLFHRYLANEPWQIVTAQSGVEALALLSDVTPSLILLDIMMPDQDGWEVFVALKQHAVTAGVPVLICSVVHEAQLAESLGAAGYVVKPVTQESLVAALRPWR